mmetsp:Transcript_4394/g.7498  ORF Transcript_4394/g.7498 Transcript_4394/m.7498 type:complete len:209 (-) Transcript_4394:843-1469(-)
MRDIKRVRQFLQPHRFFLSPGVLDSGQDIVVAVIVHAATPPAGPRPALAPALLAPLTRILCSTHTFPVARCHARRQHRVTHHAQAQVELMHLRLDLLQRRLDAHQRRRVVHPRVSRVKVLFELVQALCHLRQVVGQLHHSFVGLAATTLQSLVLGLHLLVLVAQGSELVVHVALLVAHFIQFLGDFPVEAEKVRLRLVQHSLNLPLVG